MRVIGAAAGLAALVGCGPNLVGDWDGVIVFQADDGGEYVNEMTVAKEGTADLRLYALFEQFNPATNQNELMIGYGDFEATWDKGGGVATFDLTCDWSGCDYDTVMTCDIEADGLFCDASPDYYGDDAAILQWVRAE